MILPQRVPIPERKDDLSFQDAENQAFDIAFAQGFNACIDMIEAGEALKPDGHYWDHSSKTYRDMLTPKEPEAPRAS